MMPPMKSTGINTTTRERVMETIVKPISLDPLRAASRTPSPCSMCLTMFSSMTMASSTTNPTERMRAMSERLSRLYPRRYMAANVPTIEKGSARLGMMVAERLRRKRKMTRTTRQMASKRVNLMSATESRIETERS